jgi:hypothetical protein
MFHGKKNMHAMLIYIREKLFLYAKGSEVTEPNRKVFYELMELIDFFHITLDATSTYLGLNTEASDPQPANSKPKTATPTATPNPQAPNANPKTQPKSKAELLAEVKKTIANVIAAKANKAKEQTLATTKPESLLGKRAEAPVESTDVAPVRRKGGLFGATDLGNFIEEEASDADSQEDDDGEGDSDDDDDEDGMEVDLDEEDLENMDEEAIEKMLAEMGIKI